MKFFLKKNLSNKINSPLSWDFRYSSDRSNIVRMSTIEGYESIRDIPTINSTNIAKLAVNNIFFIKSNTLQRKEYPKYLK